MLARSRREISSEQTVSDFEPAQLAGARERSKPSGWDQTRLGVLVPLGAVVVVAIVCIVVAALTSAQRADDVALERERQLLSRAIANYGEWSLHRLQSVVQSRSAVSSGDIDHVPDVAQQRMSAWLNPLRDHDLVLVFDSNGRIVHSQPGHNRGGRDLMAGAVPWLQSIVEYLRGRGAMPSGVMRLLPNGAASQQGFGDHVFLLNIYGRLSVVTAMPLGDRNAAAVPMVVTVRVIDPSVLTSISDRLQLKNLRMVDYGVDPAGDNLFQFVGSDRLPIASFAWRPQHPGAEILDTLIPFIGVALAGFALLAGLVMRYMRYTAATIAAGENRMRYLALHDPLCGLPNRNFFGERLEAVITAVKRGGRAAAVFYIDLDHFKDVNDTLGHPVGDELIRNVTLRLSHTMRADDLVARLGGDEFAVITAASSEPGALLDIGNRIIQTLCAPYSVSGHTIVIGASIGIALIDQRSGAAADIMRYADMALYRAKNEGRNRACMYDAVMDADLSQRKLIEQDLRETIENDSLNVFYQPIFNASGDKVVGVEALARWLHPTRGVIPPAEFIPIAEHSGLIVELGQRVLRRACLDGTAWPSVTVSVNVSPIQFRRLDFVKTVEHILDETGFDPARLELELTESTLLGNVDGAEAAMRRLKALGVQLALDDFGTGYSSLLYLRRFPFDKLKIDRSFVLSIEKAADAAAIVHAVVSLGRGLGMKVTAEGVETAEQHLFLRAAGVHYMQGFRFGVPMEAPEIAVRLARPGTYRSIASDAKAALAR
jgi:diguanylate cyclase (GGDEF)-like protein